MMTWTPHLTHVRRDMSFIIGQDFETNSFSDHNSIHTWRAMSIIFGLVMKSFTVMTWTPHLTHGCRDMSVEAGLDYEATCLSDGASIHAWRDMSVTKPPDESSRPPFTTEMTKKLRRIKVSTAIPRRKHPVSSAPGSLSYVGPG